MKFKDYLMSIDDGTLRHAYKSLYGLTATADRAHIIYEILSFFTQERKSELMSTIGKADSIFLTLIYLGVDIDPEHLFYYYSSPAEKERINRLEKRFLALPNLEEKRYELNDDFDYSASLSMKEVFEEKRRKNTHPKAAFAALLTQIRTCDFSNKKKVEATLSHFNRAAFPLLDEYEWKTLLSLMCGLFTYRSGILFQAEKLTLGEYYYLLSLSEAQIASILIKGFNDKDTERLFTLLATGLKSKIVSRLTSGRLKDTLCLYLFLIPDNEEEDQGIVISTDFTVRCDPRYATKFCPFASLTLLDEHYANFLISEKSVKDALTFGIRKEAIFDALDKAPLSVLSRVKAWIASYERVRLYADVLYLETDESVSHLIEVNATLKSYVFKRLSPTSLLIYAKEEQDFRKALLKLKIEFPPTTSSYEAGLDAPTLSFSALDVKSYGPPAVLSGERDWAKDRERKAALEKRAEQVSKSEKELKRYKALIDSGEIFDAAQITPEREFDSLLSANAFDRNKLITTLYSLYMSGKFALVKTSTREYQCVIAYINKKDNPTIRVIDDREKRDVELELSDIYSIEELDVITLKDDFDL